MYRWTLLIALASFVVTSCSFGEGPRGSSEWPLDSIRVNGSLSIDPVAKTGKATASVFAGVDVERPEGFLGSSPTSDRLSGNDRITVSSDLVQANHARLYGTYRTTYEYDDLGTLNYGFFRGQQLGNSIDVSINPSVIPTISVVPSVLDGESPTTNVSLSFEGLSDGLILPDGARVGVNVYEVICEKNGETVFDGREERGIPDEIPIYSIGSIEWPFIINRLDAPSLNQTIDLFDFRSTSVLNGFQNDRFDSCNVTIRSGMGYSYHLGEASEVDGFPELLDININGEFPILSNHSVGVISQPITLVIEKSIISTLP